MTQPISTPSPVDDPTAGDLTALFRPRGIAILGASSDPTKIGGRPVRFAKESGYDGGIYPINPVHAEVQGLPAYASIADVPDPVDLALVALPSAHVLEAVRACGERGVQVVTVFGAGFAETGVEGAALQEEVLSLARSYGMRVLGPNCIGSLNRRHGVVGTFAASAGVAPREEPLARVALVSQSGAIASELVVTGMHRGLLFDPWLSTGNEGDIQLADAMAHLAQDDEVEVIAAYLEGCRDGDRLRRALAIAQDAGKPVVALKVGRSDVGASAAASHTASMVGSDEVFDAVFDRYGVIRVRSMAEMFDVSYALSVGRRPTGPSLGILTGSGGVGIIAADEASEQGLEVSAPSVELQSRLKEIWPPAGVGNPIDLTAQLMNDPDLLPTFTDECLRDGSFDAVVMAMTYMGLLEPWTDQLVTGLRAAREAHPDAAIYLTSLTTPEVRRAVEELGIPVFEDVSTTVRVLGLVARREERLRRAAAGAASATPPSGSRPGRTVVPLPDATDEVSSTRFLAAAGVPVLDTRVVGSAEEAARVQAELGGRVVMKVVSPDLQHKTEVGGVVLGVGSPEEAAQAYERIESSVARHAPQARREGVLMAPMVEDGVETVMGVVNDPTFGPVVVFGLGGVLVEVLGDVSQRLAPFDHDTAREMIQEIRGAAVLHGARGAAPADVDALADALVALSHLADDHRDDIDSIDVNPLLVRPDGLGAVAVDALLVLRASGSDAAR